MTRLFRVIVRLLALAYPRDVRREWRSIFDADAAALLARCQNRHGPLSGWIRAVTAMVGDTLRGARLARADRGAVLRPGPRGRDTVSRAWRGMMGGWRDDLRIALRGLMRKPMLAVVVAATLGVGLGANVTIFGILDRVVLTPMRFETGDRVVFLALRDADRGWQFAPSQQHLEAWREKSRTLDAVEVYRPGSVQVARGGQAPERLEAAAVSVGMLSMASESPVIGRGFSAADAEPGAVPVVMLDEVWWRAEFGADPEVLGRTIRVEDEVAVIVGVWPARVRPSLQGNPAVWTPLPSGAELERGVWSIVVGLRASTFDDGDVGTELAALGGPADAPDGIPVAQPVTTFLSAAFLESIWLLFWGTLALGLVAAVNAANLLLGRADARAGELGIRAALGGSRLGLVRLFATEAALLSLAGILVGAFLGWGTSVVLVALMPADVAVLDDRVLFSGRVAAWSGLLMVGLMALCTLVPATRVRRSGVGDLIRGGRDDRRLLNSSPLRSGLVVAQVALAVLLVTGASLTLRSWRALTSVDPGWRVAETVLVGLRLPEARFPDPDARAAFWTRLTDRLGTLADVEGVTSMGNPFFRSSISMAVPVPVGWDGPPLEDDLSMTSDFGLENHFEVLGVPVRGVVRAGEGGVRTVVVNEAYERRFGPVLGRQIGVPGDSIRWTVTAIAGDVRTMGLRTDPDQLHVFLPEARLDHALHRIVVRTRRPVVTAGLIRSVISELDPQLRPAELATGSAVLAGQATRERFAALLLSVLGLTTVFIAGAGVYGVVALGVERRTREVGLRMALGAGSSSVVRSVIGRGMRPVLVGAGVGLLLAGLAARRIDLLLYGVSEWDPVSLATGAALLLGVGLAAAWIPARRATRVDPLEALRAE